MFDRKVLHDGCRNTYAFLKDGRKIILFPMSRAKVQETQRQLNGIMKKKTLFVGQRELKAVIQANEPMYLLQVRYALEV